MKEFVTCKKCKSEKELEDMRRRNKNSYYKICKCCHNKMQRDKKNKKIELNNKLEKVSNLAKEINSQKVNYLVEQSKLNNLEKNLFYFFVGFGVIFLIYFLAQLFSN